MVKTGTTISTSIERHEIVGVYEVPEGAFKKQDLLEAGYEN